MPASERETINPQAAFDRAVYGLFRIAVKAS
jgi:hypothetical protein